MNSERRSTSIRPWSAGLWAAGLWLATGVAPAAAAGNLQIFPESSGDLVTVVLLIVFFALLIAPVNALLVKPLFRVLDEREERIDGTRRRAEQLAGEADQIATRYQASIRETREGLETERRELLETARREGAEGTGEARSAAEQQIERARGELAKSLEEARSAVRREAEGLAREAATRVLGREL